MTAMIITVGVLLPVCLPLPPAKGGVVGPWEEAKADRQRGGCYICRSTRRVLTFRLLLNQASVIRVICAFKKQLHATANSGRAARYN